MKKNRLSKVLAAAGVASRRACEELIFAGRVKVNGKTVLIPQTMVEMGRDKISVDEESIKSTERKVYFLLNKPVGYLCTNSRPSKNSKLVLDLFEGTGYRLFTVGRLDRDTSGLILVTNDGHFANNVIHPSANVAKEYLAKTDKEITADHLKNLAAGGIVEGTFVKPISVSKVRRGTVKITVSEGKKREVRVLLETVGLEVVELKRIRIGNLHLGSLPVGAYRELTKQERTQLLQEE
jgi:23S rRNA pseudouridine2605 synthase